MTTFVFDETVPLLPGSVDSAALGTASPKYGQTEVNKPVKLAAGDSYELVSDGDDLEAMIGAIAPHTVNSGVAFGSVQVRFKHLRVINKGAAALAVGDTVVCAAQEALGTAQEAPYVKDGAGAVFKWRVKSLLGGTGAVDTAVLVEPLTR